MAKLTITKLHCERKQDVSGLDEPYIYIAGQRVWNGKMGKGDTRFPNKKHCFHNSVLVELKEKDGKKKFKSLESWTIPDDDEPNPVELTATSSGYHYKLSYVVDENGTC